MSDKTLTLSLRELPHQAGAYLEEQRQWSVPAGWKSEVVELPEGQVVPLTVTITAIDEGVVVGLSAQGTMEAECVRCLDPVTLPWVIHTSDVYLEAGRQKSSRDTADDFETEGDELDAARVIEKDHVNVESLLRDAIFSSAPLRPVCREDCLGLCGQCGARLDDVEPDHSHEFIDPRFAGLADFFEKSE